MVCRYQSILVWKWCDTRPVVARTEISVWYVSTCRHPPIHIKYILGVKCSWTRMHVWTLRYIPDRDTSVTCPSHTPDQHIPSFTCHKTTTTTEVNYVKLVNTFQPTSQLKSFGLSSPRTRKCYVPPSLGTRLVHTTWTWDFISCGLPTNLLDDVPLDTWLSSEMYLSSNDSRLPQRRIRVGREYSLSTVSTGFCYENRCTCVHVWARRGTMGKMRAQKRHLCCHTHFS